MICDQRSLVNQHSDGGLAITRRCKRWQCEHCHPLNCRQLKRKVASGRPDRMLTLTLKPDAYATPDEAARELRRAWLLIRLQAKRELGVQRIKFLAAFEHHKSGWPHLHIALTRRLFSQAWVSDQLRRITGSFVVDVRKFSNARSVGRYIGKYMSKAPERYAGCKRYWPSKDWIHPEEKPDPCPLMEANGWRQSPWAISHHVWKAQHSGMAYEIAHDAVRWGDYLDALPPRRARASEAQLWWPPATAEPPPTREAAYA